MAKQLKPLSMDRHRAISAEVKAYAAAYELALDASKRGITNNLQTETRRRLVRMMDFCRELIADAVS